MRITIRIQGSEIRIRVTIPIRDFFTSVALAKVSFLPSALWWFIGYVVELPGIDYRSVHSISLSARYRKVGGMDPQEWLVYK